MQIDESLLSSDHSPGIHWAPAKRPHLVKSRYTNLPKIVTCVAISASYGNVYTHYGIRSFNSNDIKDVLKAIRERIGYGYKIAVHLDNARFHHAKILK